MRRVRKDILWMWLVSKTTKNIKIKNYPKMFVDAICLNNSNLIDETQNMCLKRRRTWIIINV